MGQGQCSGAWGGQRGTDGVPLIAPAPAWPAPHMLSPLPSVSTDALREPGRRAGEIISGVERQIQGKRLEKLNRACVSEGDC